MLHLLSAQGAPLHVLRLEVLHVLPQGGLVDVALEPHEEALGILEINGEEPGQRVARVESLDGAEALKDQRI